MASTYKLPILSEALTASKTSDSVSLGPDSINFIGYLKVTANNGATTVAAKLEHSPDKINWFPLCTFTNIVNTTGSEVIYQGATGFQVACVLPNVRAVVTLTGISATVDLSLWYDPRRV